MSPLLEELAGDLARVLAAHGVRRAPPLAADASVTDRVMAMHHGLHVVVRAPGPGRMALEELILGAIVRALTERVYALLDDAPSQPR